MIVNKYFVSIEFIDSYIGDIEYRVSTGRIAPEDMKIVKNIRNTSNNTNSKGLILRN